MITHGGKQAIFMAVVSLCQQGDEVLVPAPYWVSYADIAAISGATPVFVDRSAANGYVLAAEQFERALSPRTKMFILCNPCNPTGCTYTREQLEALAAVLRKPQFRHIWVLSDEIYERLTYDGLQHVSFAALDGMKERTLLVNGFAKSHAMTGFRLGWLGCSTRSVIATAIKLQSQLNSCACSTSQHAGVAALRNVSDDMLAPLYNELENKRNAIVQVLRTIPHVVCPVPQGAFYVFPDVSYYLAKGAKSRKTGRLVNNTTDLCNYLIDEHGLALPPGDAFGAPYGVRFSYATSMSDISKAAERFRAALLDLELPPA
jgi:aspartate/methionine/tyrosine aminotransferase